MQLEISFDDVTVVYQFPVLFVPDVVYGGVCIHETQYYDGSDKTNEDQTGVAEDWTLCLVAKVIHYVWNPHFR